MATCVKTKASPRPGFVTVGEETDRKETINGECVLARDGGLVVRRESTVISYHKIAPAPDNYVLTLSNEEAQALLSVVGRVTGGGDRKFTGAVFDALKGAGVPLRYNFCRGNLRFENSAVEDKAGDKA